MIPYFEDLGRDLDAAWSKLVARTRREDDQRPQFSYLSPGLAFNPFRCSG